ncbi:hypothetical protein BGX21_004024 [Mortierella sp. AD011]|nr:hypothetical protein BGX21_004024 [Mortierella sp. AD011]
MRGGSWICFESSLPARQLLYTLILSCSRSETLAPFLTPDWPDPISPLVTTSPLKTVYIDFLGDLDYDRWTTTLKYLAPEVDSSVEQMIVRMFRLLFLDHHMERVQTLSIPITHLEPYIKYTPSLKSLQRIRFYEDDLDGTQDQVLNQSQGHQVNGPHDLDGQNTVGDAGSSGENSAQEEVHIPENAAEQGDTNATEDSQLDISNADDLEAVGNSADQGTNADEISETAQAQPGPVFDPTPRAIAFLKSHRKLFNPNRTLESFHRPFSLPGQSNQYLHRYGLLEVEPPYRWINPGWGSDPTHDSWYVGILQALESPAVVDLGNWKLFMFQLNNTPLDGIKRIRSFCDDMSDIHWDQGNLLQRCRSLERFGAALRSSDAFGWAVEEFKDRKIYEALLRDGVACAPISLAQGTSHSSFFGPGLDPVPLRRVNLRNGNDDFIIPVLKDICWAFKKTLESIQVRMYSSEPSFPTNIFCNMPHLTTLDIHLKSNRSFSSDTSFLEACPSLRFLRLRDNIQDQSDIVGTSACIQKPWYLPKLQELVLVGTSCNVFNYETFTYTRNIEVIRLERTILDFGVRTINDDYLEHLSRHSWSWRWDLPRLHTMALKGSPAHLFQTCLLERCPRLQRLSLNLDQVPRSLSISRDMTKTTTSFQSSVRSLILKGRWVATETADLPLFIRAWFNNLQYLKTDVAQFSCNKSLIESLKSMRSLRKANFLRHSLSKYDAWKLGLEEVEFKCSHEWDLDHRIEISIADARKRRMLAREQQLAEEAERMKRERRTLEFQDALDIMSDAFSILNLMDESRIHPDNGSEDHDIELSNTSSNTSRCSTVDSGCKIGMESESTDEEHRHITEDEIQDGQEANEDLISIMKSVCVFKGKRYHFTEN